jgi:hypothetical protein
MAGLLTRKPPKICHPSYLIYYHDLKPWDAIRVMRRQRPGSVERRVSPVVKVHEKVAQHFDDCFDVVFKVQEDTVVLFHHLLTEFGKHSLENLEQLEKEWKEARRRERTASAASNCENMLLHHTASFYGPQQRTESKVQRLERMQQRMRRCKSMPKMSEEEVRIRLWR